jgi:hypothetical protein
MLPAKLAEVMAFLATLPVDGDDKVELFVGWAKMVGVRVNASQRQKVRNTGTDRTQFPSLPPTA